MGIEHGLGKVLYDLVIALVVGGLTGVVTGLVVEKMIRRREDKRWASTKNVLYVAILRILDRLLFQAVPDEFKGQAGKICVFSKTAYIGLKFEPENEYVFSGLDLLPIIKKRLAQLSLNKPQPLRSDPYLGMSPVIEAREKLETVFQTYGPVAEPTLRGILLHFMSSAKTLEEWETMNVDLHNAEYGDRYVLQFIITLRLANEVREAIIAQGILSTHVP
jgi:hypothetical protein